MDKDEMTVDLIDLGVASEETKGHINGAPEDVALNQLNGISDE